MRYQLKLQQLVNYSRCRIYRKFISSLVEDTNIRLNGDSYLFYYMTLCSLANFRTSRKCIDGFATEVYVRPEEVHAIFQKICYKFLAPCNAGNHFPVL